MRYSLLPRGVQHMRASGVSLSFHHMSHHPLTLADGRFVFVWLFLLLFVFLFASCFASVMGFSQSSARIRKKVSVPHRSCFSYLLGRSPPVFTHYGCRFVALGGTPPRRVIVWLNTSSLGDSALCPRLQLQLRRSRCRLHLHVPIQLVIPVKSYLRRRLQSELVILICLWTRGSEQVLRLRGGQHTCTRRYYLFKDIFSYDPTTPPSPPLEVAQLQLLGQRTGLMI